MVSWFNFRSSETLTNSQSNFYRTLRAYRVLAFKYILQQQERGSSSLRGSDSALLLTAAAPWFLNGLHSAPDYGPCSRDLMGKILPLVDRGDADIQTLAYPASTRAITHPYEEDGFDENENENENEHEREPNLRHNALSIHSDSGSSEDEAPSRPVYPQYGARPSRSETVPYNPYGIVFLREIRIGEGVVVPRFRDVAAGMITSKTFRYIFGVERNDIDGQFFKGQMLVPANPGRVSNKTRSTATRIISDETEAPRIFNLTSRGYHLPPREEDTGSDIGEIINLTDDEDDIDMDGDIDKTLTQLWRQFLVDLTAKVSNRKGALAPSYCILSKPERDRVDDKTYQNLNLRAYFDNCQYRKGTEADWESAFERCWPPPGKLLTLKTQNYPTMKYYISWGALINNRGPVPVEEMRQSLHDFFFALKWIPNFQADRVWYTKRDPKFNRFPECDPMEAAPRILIRWS